MEINVFLTHWNMLCFSCLCWPLAGRGKYFPDFGLSVCFIKIFLKVWFLKEYHDLVYKVSLLLSKQTQNIYVTFAVYETKMSIFARTEK